MQSYEPILLGTVFILGGALGALFLRLIQLYRLTHFKQIAEQLVLKGESEAEAIRKNSEIQAKQQEIARQRDLEYQWQNERRKIQGEEDRLKVREDKLDSRMALVEKKLIFVERSEATLASKKDQLNKAEESLSILQKQLLAELEKTAGLSSKEAKEELLKQIRTDVQRDAANYIRKSAHEARLEADKEAQKIITTAINRLSVPCVSEATINTVSIPNDEMKGRIIGREGRNIRALERAVGVNIIIDDTPSTIVLSGFDPIRMQIAKIAINDLVLDGRIHPTSIEEAVQKAKITVEKNIRRYGEDAAVRAGVIHLHPELIMLLGKLKFRFSYGQNILDHSLEVSHLMGIMAAELGLDVALAKRIGLLHDFGKAVSHEIEGSHAIIGQDLALKYGESKEIANGIGCHHGEIEATTIEGSLCSAADAISASRQGARSEFVEEYVKRLKNLEELVAEFPGVEKAYAMQAGREVRVVVLPDLIDDDGVITLARNITKKIENQLTYPGKIKVTLIREKRVIEYAV